MVSDNKWFLVCGFQITPVRMYKATAASVYPWGVTRKPRISAKGNYYPTFDEAKTELLRRLRARVAACETEIKVLQYERASALRWIGDLVEERITEASIWGSAAYK